MDEILKLLLADIESAVTKLAELAPEVWAIYVRQVMINGARHVVWAVFFLFCEIWALYLFRKSLVGKRENPHNDDWLGACVITFCAIVVLLVLVFVQIDSAVGRFLNPQYYAITNLVKMLKGN